MTYEPRGQQIARCSPSKVFSTQDGRDVHKLFDFIKNSLAQCGWQRFGNTMKSGIQETYAISDPPYKARICIDLVKNVATQGNTSNIVFKVYDERYFNDEIGVTLACSSDEYRLFVCPFQIIIRPKSVQLGGRNNLLISSLRIPPFIRESTTVNAVVAIEADQFFQNFYGTGFTDRAYTALVSRSGSAFEWSGSGSNQGMPQYIGIGNDNLFFLNGNFDFFAPAWMCWGVANKDTVPSMQGFLWNTVNWYSNVPNEYETHALRGEEFVSIIPSHFNNTMMYKLS